MASAVLGKVSPTPKGEYVSTQDYDRLDVVTYEGYPYLAKSNVPSGNLPTDELYWMPLLTGLDFAPGGYGLGGSAKEIDDWNTAIENGFYRSSASCINGPVAGSQYHGMMINYSSVLGNQLVFKTWTDGQVEIWSRRYYNGAFAEWKPVLTSDTVGTYAAPSGYGLGVSSGKDCSDFNTALDIGWYWMTGGNVQNAPAEDGGFKYGCLRVERRGAYITQTAIFKNMLVIRSSEDGGATWQPWEWVNPSMSLGVEYRTTERWNGKVVYTKLVDLGTLPDSATSEKDIVFFAGSMAELVSVDVSTYAGSVWRTEDTRWSKYVYKDSAGAHIVIKATENVSGYSGFAVFKYTKN